MSSRNKKKNHQTPDTGYEKCIRMDQDAKASSKIVSVECNTFLAEYESKESKFLHSTIIHYYQIVIMLITKSLIISNNLINNLYVIQETL